MQHVKEKVVFSFSMVSYIHIIIMSSFGTLNLMHTRLHAHIVFLGPGPCGYPVCVAATGPRQRGSDGCSLQGLTGRTTGLCAGSTLGTSVTAHVLATDAATMAHASM